MNASQAIKTFGLDASNINAGAAEDLICTHCGYRAQFSLRATGCVVLTCDGQFPGFGDFDIDPETHCWCPECGEDGKLKNFTVKGLDAELRKRVGL